MLEDGSVSRSASRETTKLEENNEVRASLGFKIVPEKAPQLSPRWKTCERGFCAFNCQCTTAFTAHLSPGAGQASVIRLGSRSGAGSWCAEATTAARRGCKAWHAEQLLSTRVQSPECRGQEPEKTLVYSRKRALRTAKCELTAAHLEETTR